MNDCPSGSAKTEREVFLLGGGRLFTRSALQRHEEEGLMLHSAVVVEISREKQSQGGMSVLCNDC